MPVRVRFVLLSCDYDIYIVVEEKGTYSALPPCVPYFSLIYYQVIAFGSVNKRIPISVNLSPVRYLLLNALLLHIS